MFEKRLNEVSNKMGGNKKKFFVLTHTKHRREIYFTNDSSSINFIKQKFKLKTKALYFLIKLNLLQPFLKKIYLSEKFGDVIFVGGQIKGFNLKEKKVYSFPLYQKEREKFLKGKKFQEKISGKNLAPIIFKINNSLVCSEEELLDIPKKINIQNSFSKILEYYKKEGIKKVKIKDYIKLITKEKEIFEVIKKGLEKLKPLEEEKILVTSIHGDFSKEQFLIKGGSYVFTDWNPRKGLIISDLVNFFGNEEMVNHKKLLENNSFKELLNLYPREVKKNLLIYLILNEISSILEKEGDFDLHNQRLKEFLSYNLSFRKN